MSELHNDVASANVADTSTRTITLTIDYGNGAQKSFAGIPWQQPDGILEVLKAASSISPGLVYETHGGGFTRGGQQPISIASIDGVAAGQDKQWLVWVNNQLTGSKFTEEESHPEFMAPLVINPGDVIAFKLAAGS